MFKKYNLEADAYVEISEEEFLRQSVLYNSRLLSRYNQFDPIASELFEMLCKGRQTSRGTYKEESKKRTILRFLHNLCFAYFNGVPLAVSRDRNFYRVRERLGTSDSYQDVTNIADLLEDLKWIKKEAGNHYTRRASCYWVTGEAEQLFNKFRSDEACSFEYAPVEELVVLKNSNKQRIKFQETGCTKKTRRILSEYNSLISSTTIGISDLVDWEKKPNETFEELNSLLDELHKATSNSHFSNSKIKELIYNKPYQDTSSLHYQIIWDIVAQKPSKNAQLRYLNSQFFLFNLMRYPNVHQLSRIFNNGKFSNGGRLAWSPIQGMSKPIRSLVTLNGQQTSEIDFSCFHPSMLYHRAGLNVPPDPYIHCKGSPLREVFKITFNSAINASSRGEAIKAVVSELRFKKIDLMKVVEGSSYFRRHRNLYSSISDIYDELLAYHWPIQNTFGSGEGARLMRVESDIACEVLWHFTQKGIPVIPIHDSFIVPRLHAEALKQTMQKIYFREFKKGIEVSIN